MFFDVQDHGPIRRELYERRRKFRLPCLHFSLQKYIWSEVDNKEGERGGLFEDSPLSEMPDDSPLTVSFLPCFVKSL